MIIEVVIEVILLSLLSLHPPSPLSSLITLPSFSGGSV